MKKQRKYLGFAALAVAACSIVVGSCVTYASYMAAVSITQQTGYLGEFNQDSIFLNANIWEKDNPVYYMYRFKEGSTGTNRGVYLLPSKTITPTIGGTNYTLYVFEYDKSLKDLDNHLCEDYLFFRMDNKLDESRFSKTASTKYFLRIYSASRDVNLYVDEGDPNHFLARHVELAANATLKVEDRSGGVGHYEHFSNATESDGYTLDGDGNVKVTSAGTYTISFYKDASNNNHIVLVNESALYNFKWNQTGRLEYDTRYNYWSIDGWDDNGGYHNSLANCNHLRLNANEQLEFGS